MRRRPYDIDHEDYTIVLAGKFLTVLFTVAIDVFSIKKVHEISICFFRTL